MSKSGNPAPFEGKGLNFLPGRATRPKGGVVLNRHKRGRHGADAPT